MTDYLAEKDWKKVLKLPINKQVKKTGISATLKAYAKAVSAKKTEDQGKALDEVISKARTVKRTKGFHSDLVNYLDEMIRAAEKAMVKLDSATDGAGNPGLQALLTVAKTRDAKSPLTFVVAPGKPTSGLVLSRKSITAEMRKVASNQRGKAGIVLEGSVFYESGKYVFALEKAPPPGLAKLIQRAVLADTGRNIRVLVRGADQDIDAESDQEPDFKEPTPPPKGPGDKLAKLVQQYVDAIDAAAGSPPAEPGKALANFGVQGRKLLEMIASTKGLADGDRRKLEEMVKAAVVKARKELAPDNQAQAKFQAAFRRNKQLFATAGKMPGQDQLRRAFLQELKTVQNARDQDKWDAAMLALPTAIKRANAVLQAANAVGGQHARHDVMKETASAVQRSYFSKGSAIAYAKENLKAGNHFKVVLKALAAAEGAKSAANLDALEKACKDYLAHVIADLSDRKQRSKEAVRKKQIAEELLVQVRHWRLADELAALPAPNPTWDRQTEMRAAALQAKLVFEEGNQDGKSEAAGVSGSWWVENLDWSNPQLDPATGKASSEKTKKQFLFKASETEAFVQGFPRGGSANREVLGKALNDHLQGFAGIDVGVPETQMVAIANERLPVADAMDPDVVPEPNPDFVGKELTGSIQHFEKSDGELQQLMYAPGGDALLQSIPVETTHKVALLDLMSLNMDRHSGNFLVTNANDPSTPPGLVPIDQGLVFPSRDGFNERRTKLGSSHNAVHKLNGKDEKMSAAMIEQLALVDPDEVVASLTEAQDAMRALHPGLDHDAAVPAENLDLTRRSILFLKAAASELTIAEIYGAMMVDAELIFDSSDGNRARDFGTAIANAKVRGAAVRRYQQLDAGARKAMGEQLKEMGYCLPGLNKDIDRWIEFNAEKAFKAFDTNTVNPSAKAELSRMLDEFQTKKRRAECEAAILPMLQKKKLNEAYDTIESSLAREERELAQQHDAGSDAAVLHEANRAEIIRWVRDGTWEAYCKYEKRGDRSPEDDPVEQPPQVIRQQIRHVNAFLEYERLGGDRELFKYAVDGEVTEVTQRLRFLKAFKAEAAGLAQL